MAIVAAKVKQRRAARSPVAARNNAKTAKREKSPDILAAEAASGVPWGERTRLASDAGKVVEAIFRFTDKHKLPPSLKRRLRSCASDLWDVEMEEDVQSGAYQCSEFGKMAERASQNYKAGKTISLEEALERMKSRRQ